MIEQKRLIQEFPNLQIYFHELISEAIKHQRVEADEHIAFYLVNLLSEFTKMNKVYGEDKEGDTPLALLFFRAQSETPATQTRLLKYLGDFSLFISGFFQDSFNRKLIDMDYYIAMGGGAYYQLSSMASSAMHQDLFSHLFSDLASRFVKWIDILSEVSESSHITTQTDLLRLYEKFLRTGSERLRDMLVQQGIFPAEGASTKIVH